MGEEVLGSVDDADASAPDGDEADAAEDVEADPDVETDAEATDAETDAGGADVDPDVDGDDPDAEADTAAPEPAPAASGSIWARAPLLVPLYVLMSCVVTWPLVAHLPGSLTYGDEPVGTVPLFNLWTMRWNQLRIGDLYRDYWNAPIFYPNDGAFALSEPQPLTGLVFAPISWLTGNPVLAFNLIFLAIFALNGYAAARLSRHLGVAPGPAALAGAMAVGLSFVANEMGVLQLTVVFPLLLLIESVVRWAQDGGRWPAAKMGIWLAATFLTCGYYGLFALLGIGLPALALARRDWLQWSRLAEVALAVVVFAVPTLPFLLGQAQYTSDYERSDSTIENLSAAGWEYRQLVPAARGADIAPWLNEMQEGHGLYPGTALLFLAFTGFWFGGRRVVRAAPSEEVDSDGSEGEDQIEVDGQDDIQEKGTVEDEVEIERDVPRFLLAGAAVAWLLSQGLRLSIFGFEPYEVVRTLVPGYETLRSPFRFAALFELFLLGLAAYGLHEVWHWRPRVQQPRLAALAGPVAAAVIVLLGVAEVSIAPVRLFEVDRAAPDWAEWLRDEAPDSPPTGDGAVAFLPFSPSNSAVDYEDTTRWMVQALDAGQTPMVNGYSGLWPSDSSHLETLMRGYPTDEADATLRDFGVTYLVVQTGWMNSDPARREWLTTRHPLVFAGEDAFVYQLAA